MQGNEHNAIFEAKCSFSSTTNCPKKTKATLKDALNNQVQPWMSKVSAVKSYVVASYLRDPSAGGDPSLLAFVDPEGPTESGALDMDLSWVRRANYSAWLTFMGFTDAARRLRYGVSEGSQPYPFFYFEIAKKTFAFPYPYFWLDDIFFSGDPHHLHRFPVIAGIEVSRLEAISEALNGEPGKLLELRGLEQGSMPAQGEGYEYSIFPDGTFFGYIPSGLWPVNDEMVKL